MLLTSPTHTFISWMLKKPNGELIKYIELASKEIPVEHVTWYIHPEDSFTVGFMGCALRGPSDIGVICIANNISKCPEEYIIWVMKHELRHLLNLPFRKHDLHLYDIGYEEPTLFGFFKEDIREIARCPILQKVFRKMAFSANEKELVNWEQIYWGIKLGLTVNI